MTVDLVADMAVINPFDFFVDDYARDWPFAYEPRAEEGTRPYLEPIPAGPLLRNYMAGLKFEFARSTIDFLIELNRHVQNDVKYLIRMEPGVQTPEETLKTASRLLPR